MTDHYLVETFICSIFTIMIVKENIIDLPYKNAVIKVRHPSKKSNAQHERQERQGQHKRPNTNMDIDQTKVSATSREGKTTQMIGRNKVMSQDPTIHPMMIQ